MTVTQAMLAGVVVFLLCTWCIRTLSRLAGQDRKKSLAHVLFPPHDPGLVGRIYRIYLVTLAVVTQIAIVVAALRPSTDPAAWVIVVAEIAFAGVVARRIWRAPMASRPPRSS